ncbi:hypothetical protein SAMN05216359_10837 [Roseateles sp. YR242]|uniref:hypothetical protein n=1 Tax=Roseateles sp. YR242 TaxID=1855305 RepID=UPI0008B18BE4|nr:hypothetical protein [Roseateles sp. YR242]SEL36315.1 hypothetical protein SAMN05216359_10837 [Roseateles sp. YR242]
MSLKQFITTVVTVLLLAGALGGLLAGVSGVSFEQTASSPVSDGIPHVTSKRKQESILAQSCRSNGVVLQKPLLARDIYIDRRFLPLLVGTALQGKTARWLPPTRDRLIEFMLRSGWSAVETDEDFRSITEDYIGTKPTLRFELMPAGSGACRNWSTQTEYPRQVVPKLRELGVSPEQCVGISELPEPTAEGRVLVERKRLYYDADLPTLYIWKLDIRAGVVKQGESGPLVESAHAVMHLRRGVVGQHGNGDLSLPCPGSTQESGRSPETDILASLRPNGSGPLAPRPIVTRTLSTAEVNTHPATDKDIASFRWLKSDPALSRFQSQFGIDATGTMWTVTNPSPPSSWALRVAQPDRILHTQIPLESQRLRYLTLAFARTAANGYGVVTQIDNASDEIRLFEYDHDLQLLRAFTLTAEQWASILPKTM